MPKLKPKPLQMFPDAKEGDTVYLPNGWDDNQISNPFTKSKVTFVNELYYAVRHKTDGGHMNNVIPRKSAYKESNYEEST